jgi:histidinol dehydrogenase
MVAGPSEIMIIADGKSDAKVVAADMLSQAEHDRLATAILATNDLKLASAVQIELGRQIENLSRKEIAAYSIDRYGKIIVCSTLSECVEVANMIAPEHLELMLDNSYEWLAKVKNAGSVFLGRYTPEALGDYFAGANHTLPTNGTARFSSPLSVDDFVKKTQYICYSKEDMEAASEKVARFAECEGLTAHAKSATVRFQ